MRSMEGPGGIRLLRWADAPDGARTRSSGDAPAGAYGHSTVVFPEVPPDRRWTGAPPELLRTTLASLVPGQRDTYEKAKLAWIEIPLSTGSRDISTLLERVVLHCTTASNLEIINQTLSFDRSGTTLSAPGAFGGAAPAAPAPASVRCSTCVFISPALW